MKKLDLETKYSLIGTISIGICLYSLSFYEDFLTFQEHLISLIPAIIGIIIGIVGVILTGLALLISFFDKGTKERFDKKHVEMTLNWFVYLSKVSGIYAVLLIILFVVLISKRYTVLPKIPLYGVTLIYIYYFLYIVFYLISVIKNIVSIFRTNNNLELCEKIITENNIDALFIQQEIIFKILVKNNLTDLDDIKNKIVERLRDEPEEKREYLSDFFSKYHGQNFKDENKTL